MSTMIFMLTDLLAFYDKKTTLVKTANKFSAMVLVYDYHSTCVSLMNKYMSGGASGAVADGNGAFHDPFSSDPDAPRPYTHQVNAV